MSFPALFDRLIQNLRRYLGYDVQYFAAIEPQKRLAPHDPFLPSPGEQPPQHGGDSALGAAGRRSAVLQSQVADRGWPVAWSLVETWPLKVTTAISPSGSASGSSGEADQMLANPRRHWPDPVS
jgi:hypothetical protein